MLAADGPSSDPQTQGTPMSQHTHLATTYRMHSMTETTRRLRVAGRLARARVGAPTNARVEVGHRVVPQAIATAPTTEEEALSASYAPEDDLSDFDTIEWAARTNDVRRVGAVVHLYVSTRDGFGEFGLEDVIVVWLGNDDEEPAIIDSRFVRYAG